jgi:dienelactone hydrolase
MNLLAAAVLLLQDEAVLKPEEQPKKMLYAYLQAECGKSFDARRKAVAAMKTPEDVRKRQEALRANFVAALGGFPEKTPLRAKVTGTLARDGYRVEKVIYESRPEHYVTANFYVPEGKGPFPGVLFPCGHFNNAKAAETYQRACILLAKNGIAALSFDPISQGERVQLLAPDGKPAAGYGTSEHTLLGVGALLVGECAATYLVWDGIRSLDYLAGRPEVDPRRLGCFGNSGGGTQTAYLMALDERILCAVPNCYITSLERLFATIGPQDAEQNIPGQVAFGMEHADYLTLRAPRPTQISATTRDFFDIQGAWTTFREAKVVYGVLGHGERVDLFEFNDAHAISKPMREAGLRWFRRWLAGVDDAPVEGDFAVSPEADLLCTPGGQVMKDLKGKTAFEFVAEREKEQAAKRGKLGKDELRREVRRLIALPEKRVAAGFAARGPGRGVWQTEPGVLVPARSLGGAKPDGLPTLVLRADGGALPSAAAGTLLDLRGFGETAPEGRKGNWERYFGSDWKESFLGVHLGRPLLGQRVGDLLSVIDGMKVEAVEVVAAGAAAPVALHAAALDERIKAVRLEDMVVSWSAVARTPVTANQLTNVVPGALRVYDLPDLAESVSPRALTLHHPRTPDGKPVSQDELEKVYRRAREAYGAAGAAPNLVLRASP